MLQVDNAPILTSGDTQTGNNEYCYDPNGGTHSTRTTVLLSVCSVNNWGISTYLHSWSNNIKYGDFAMTERRNAAQSRTEDSYILRIKPIDVHLLNEQGLELISCK
jgi:hypothetical protein